MKDERMLILSMLQEGKLSADEAASLLEALGTPREADEGFEGGTTDFRTDDGEEGRRHQGESSFQVDVGAMWDEAMHLVGKARDRVEVAIERTRRRMAQAGGEARQVAEDASRSGKEAWDEVRDETLRTGNDMRQQAGDFFSDVERGLSKVAAELPDALSRFMKFEFGPGATKKIAWHYEGAFETPEEVVEIFVSTDDGTVRIEGVDANEYRVDIENKVRSDDEEEAAQIAREATRWETFANGFRLDAGIGRDVRGDVVMRLPKGWKYALEVETSDGGITVEGVHCVDLRVNSSDGSLRLKDVTSEGIQATSADGSIRLEGIVADRVTAVSADGSVRIEGDVGVLSATTSDGNVRAGYAERDGDSRRERVAWELRTSDGSIRVDVPDDEEFGYELDLASADGTVRIDVPGVESVSRGTERRGVHVVTPGFAEKALQFAVRARTADGSVSVRSSDEEGRR